MKNQVIEVINEEHGKKVIEYWESQGFKNIYDLQGDATRDGKDDWRYYGIIDGHFDNYTLDEAIEANAEIIHLPTESPKEENTFPKVMLVSDDGIKWYKRVVFMKKRDRFLAWFSAKTVEESESIYEIYTWRYAKELPEKVELTKSEIAEKFGVSVDQLVINDC